jgi:hypothetical protein
MAALTSAPSGRGSSHRSKALRMMAEGRTFSYIAEALGISRYRVSRLVGASPKVGRGQVPTSALATAFERSGLSASEVAISLGWDRKFNGRDGRYPDSDRVMKVLGLRDYNSKAGMRRRKYVDESTALKLAEAIGVDPTECGF